MKFHGQIKTIFGEKTFGFNEISFRIAWLNNEISCIARILQLSNGTVPWPIIPIFDIPCN
jgi:hypothetical protein